MNVALLRHLRKMSDKLFNPGKDLNRLGIMQTLQESGFLRLGSTSATAPAEPTKDPSQAQSIDPLKANPYFEKYKDKLKTIFANDPQGFVDAMNKLHGTNVQIAKKDDAKKAANYSMTKERKLDSVMKMEMLNDLNTEEIKNIWSAYHEERSKLCDSLSIDEYKIIEERAQQYKTFLFALPRSNQGYEFILAQWLNNECHFTPLINFQAYGENAPSIMSLIFFKDLMDSKKIVLEMCEVDAKNCSHDDAKFLEKQMRLYYLHAKENETKMGLLQKFTKAPAAFKHMDLIDELKSDEKKAKESA